MRDFAMAQKLLKKHPKKIKAAALIPVLSMRLIMAHRSYVTDSF